MTRRESKSESESARMFEHVSVSESKSVRENESERESTGEQGTGGDPERAHLSNASIKEEDSDIELYLGYDPSEFLDLDAQGAVHQPHVRACVSQ